MWSIAIYTGISPFDLQPAPPVLTKSHVTDISADFVADPFMLRRDHTWYMFFEVMSTTTKFGEIGLATSNDALNWTYDRIVLKEPFHLSYPYVFEWQKQYYMLPETLGAGAVCLYKALDFPYNWSVVARLIDSRLADPSIVRFHDRWWLFACSTPYQHDTLRLYCADELTGPWTEHPKSPLVQNDKCRARPAGRILKFGNRLFRFAQDCTPQYGASVRAFEITNLTKDSYAEVELRIPILKASGTGWNAKAMHHLDAHQQADGRWLACVDGTN
jgi:beta-xylosidase